MGVIHLFGLFWVLAFLLGTTDFIISGAVSIWYFQQG
jgi:Plasma-membrane choline transporter